MKKIIFLISLFTVLLGYSQQQQYLLDFEPDGNDGEENYWVTFDPPVPTFQIVDNPDPDGVNNTVTKVLQLDMPGAAPCYAGVVNYHGTLGTWELDGMEPSNLTLSMDVNRSSTNGVVGIKFANATNGTLFEITDSQGQVSTANIWETLTWDISAGAASGENMNIDQVVVFIDFTCGNPDTTEDITLLIDNITWGANKLTDPPAPTCNDGFQNGNETDVDCGGPDCDPCIVDPTDGPFNNGSTGTDYFIYSELSGNPNSSDFSGFNLVDFSGGGITISEPDLNGDTVIKAENIDFFGSAFGENFNATGTYTYVHLNYYATTSTAFNFSLVDDSLSSTVCCGNPEEPFYRFGPGQDAPLENGQWVSVFIPLSHYANYPPLVSGTWDGTDLKQTLFTGNGTVYIDNIFFSTTNVLSSEDFGITNFKVFPNPTTNHWDILSNSQINNVEVFDILGKQVLSVTPNNNFTTLNASNLKNGVFFARIQTETGIQVIRLVKTN